MRDKVLKNALAKGQINPTQVETTGGA